MMRMGAGARVEARAAALVGLSAVLAAQHCYALPSYDAPWPKIVLNDSSGQPSPARPWLRDDKDEKLIWLLPPAHGAIEVGEAQDQPAAELCAKLKDKLSNLSASHEEFRDYVAHIVAAMPRLLQVTSSFNRSAAAIAAWRQRSDVHRKMTGYLSARLNATRELAFIETKQQHCERYCADWLHDSAIAHTRLTDARQSLRAFQGSHPQRYEELAVLDKALQDAAREHGELAAQLASYRGHIAELETLLTRDYRQLANQPAGELNVRYLPGHSALLKRWQAENPGYRFKIVPLAQMKLFARLVPTTIDDYYLASIPAFLGFAAEGLPRLLAGQWLSQPQRTELPAALKGRFYLSLHGACSLVDSSFFKDKGLAIQRQQQGPALPRYAAVLQYHYPVTMAKTVTVSFNAAKIYTALSQAAQSDQGAQADLGAQSGGILTGERFAELMAADALRPLVAIEGQPLTSRQRDRVIATVAYQVLAMMMTPTLTLAGELSSPYALSANADEPPLSRATGGWLPLTGEDHAKAQRRLQALPEQTRRYGPNEPLLVPGMTHFGHFRLDGL